MPDCCTSAVIPSLSLYRCPFTLSAVCCSIMTNVQVKSDTNYLWVICGVEGGGCVDFVVFVVLCFLWLYHVVLTGEKRTLVNWTAFNCSFFSRLTDNPWWGKKRGDTQNWHCFLKCFKHYKFIISNGSHKGFCCLFVPF